jgi:hypothetical protein
MFCFSKKKILKSVEEPSPIVSKKNELAQYKKVSNSMSPTLLKLDQDTPVLKLAQPLSVLKSSNEPSGPKLLGEQPKVNILKGTRFFPNNELQESPNLTPEEIKKIQDNLELIKEFNKDLFDAKNTVLQATLPILIDKAISDIPNNTEFIKNALEICAGICGLVAALEVIAIVTAPYAFAFILAGAILATTAEFISLDNSSDITGKDLSAVTGYQVEFNNTAFRAQLAVFDYLKDNVNENRDAVFKFNDKEFKLRDLINAPLQKGTVWDNSITLAQRKYRNYFVSQQLVREQVLDLYFIQDIIDYYNERDHQTETMEHGHCFQPCAAPNPPGTQRVRKFDKSDIGQGVEIFNNSEVVHFNHCQDFCARGNTDENDKDKLVASYLNAIKEFTGQFPTAYVYPWSVGEKNVLSQRWYIVLGKPKLRDDQNKPNYTLPDNKFLYWLFIDDGVGNIINPDGVMFRYDFLRTQRNLGTSCDICLHAQQIADETCKNDSYGTLKYTDNIICSSADFRYGPKESATLNQKHHVYTGDLMGIKK